MNACAQLEVVGEGRVALEQVAVEGRLVDLLAAVEHYMGTHGLYQG